MPLLPWRRRDSRVDPVEQARDLARRLEETGSERERIARGLVEMIHCVKELSLDRAEVGAVELKAQLDDLARLLRAGERGANLDEHIDARQREVLAYAERLRGYLDEREGELKRIVDFLSRELAALGAGNEAYHLDLEQRSARLEAVSQLQDIRRMRQELQGEVVVLRETVRKKQRDDQVRMESLQREVDTLRSDVAKARNDALVDGLTGAWNRLAFDQRLALLVERRALSPAPLSLLMLDIDHFKSINDRYGHPVGDRVLMALVLACRQQVRKDDFLARYGGEEFALIMPATSARAAWRSARRLCRSQATREYAVPGHGSISFTVSIGVAEVQAGETPEALVARADAALYQAKQGGRNRAVLDR